MKARRNPLLLTVAGLFWFFVIGFGIHELSGAIGRISDPEHADSAERIYEQATTGIGTVIGMIVSVIGTWRGILPGTRPRFEPLAPAEIETLEKLADLRDESVLSDAEFAEQKARLLGDPIE